MSAILNLVSNMCMLGCSIIGAVTIINKTGKFFQIIDDNKTDGFRKAFDTITLESIDDINKSVASVNIISNNFGKIIFTVYDITVGNKYIKKDKDGKIIICNKTKIQSAYKDKIEELNTKVKKYQEELSKMKDTDKKKLKPFKDISHVSDVSVSSSSSSSSDMSDDISSDEDDNKPLKNKDNEFFLES
jgi:hypothetical protein